MAQVSIDIPVENIAGMIDRMDEKELETLCLLLNDEGLELLRRKKEAKTKDFKSLSRDEVFDV